MDLVDEELIVLLQVGQDRRQVARALDRRSGGDANRHAHLRGDDVREGGLAQAGWAVKEDVVERFVAMFGGVDRDPQVVFQLFLADELAQPPGPEGVVDRLVVVLGFGANDPLARRQRAPSRILVLLRGL